MNNTSNTNNGIIIKAISGFYYVKKIYIIEGDIFDIKIVECKAKGTFKKIKQKLLVGDRVVFEIDPLTKTGFITEVLERKNSLVRPPLANLDMLYIICSVCDPPPNLFVLDKLIAISEYKNIEPVIVFNKTDMEDCEQYSEIYKQAGFIVFEVSAKTKTGIDKLKKSIKGISAFIGNTGVGKSSLLNVIDERLSLATGETSKKLGRGKHTTRHVELLSVESGYVADTPGFSSLDLERYETILKQDIANCFREFAAYTNDCKFTSCSHRTEKDCAVLSALDKNKISKSRHDNYISLYNDAVKIKEWEIRG